jgi:hypothetical protein
LRYFVASLLVVLAMFGLPVAASAASPAPAAAALSAASAPAGSIVAMSCPTSKSCVGIGSTEGALGGTSFLRTWNGKAWGPAYGALPGSASDSLYDLSCLSAMFCVAAGSRAVPGGQGPVAAVWKGTSWSAVQAPPAPASAVHQAWFYQVSCATPKFCVAVGDYTANDIVETSAGFADLWNGTKWTLSWKMPPGTNQSFKAGDLSGVSCKSAVSCVAVGDTYTEYTTSINTDPTFRPVALIWSGKWRKVTPPVPAGGHGLLSGVSCWSAKGCEVVGAYYPKKLGKVRTVALAESWNAGKWAVGKPQSPTTAPVLGQVSCLSSSSCLAVGTSSVVAQTTRSFGEALKGKKWVTVPVAVPAHGTGKSGAYPNSYIIDSVTCATSTDCVAFGVAGAVPYGVSLSDFAEAYKGSRLSNIAAS